MRYKNSNISEALRYLENFSTQTILSFEKAEEKAEEKEAPQYFEHIFRIDTIQNIAKTKDFIKRQRGISLPIANKYF